MTIEREKLKEVNINTIMKYIKESIEILINFKIEEAIKLYEKELKKKLKMSNITQDDYEKVIRKLESDIRNHIQVFCY